MKAISLALSDDIEQVRAAMGQAGYRPIPHAALEKDVLVTEILHMMAGTVLPTDFTPVFCGGTCLSKAHDQLERMSEDVDFKIVRDAGLTLSKNQQRKRLSALKDDVLRQLQGLGFRSEDLEVSALDENQYIEIHAHYRSRYAPESESLVGHSPATRSSMNVRKTDYVCPYVLMRKVWPVAILPQNQPGSIIF